MISKWLRYITTNELRLIFFAIGYGILSIPVFVITKTFIHIFFAWNMILAVLPLLVSMLLRCKSIKREWIKWIMIVIWILLLPNAFYIMTDFIHLTNHTFYIYEHPYAPLEYIKAIDSYVALIHIFIGAIMGVLLACKSIDNALQFLKKRFSKWTHVMILDISLLSSIGIYIGRFLRFNSWDILRPIQIVTSVFDSLDFFALYFIILLIVTHIILIYLVVPFMQDAKKD